MGLSDVDKRIVWVHAGGRCVLCKRYLLEGQIAWKEYSLGEGAHIVGHFETGRQHREPTKYPGDHYIKVYIVKNGRVVASDHRDVKIVS